MATLYRKKNRFFLAWYVDGVRYQRSTGIPADQPERARQAKAELEACLEIQAAAAKTSTVPFRTFGGFRRQWIQKRRENDVGEADHDESRLLHARELDPLQLSEARPRHIIDFVQNLKKRMGPGRDQLSPRTVRHVFFLVRQIFEAAQIAELVTSNPCVLPRKTLPGKKDKDPTWRSGAIFTRDEVQSLISDPLIPEDRRVLYALLFLTGCRIGEMADRRWRDYDAAAKPLGRLAVHSSFHTKRRVSKATKTEDPRQVPVHPTLAKVLAGWKLGGWERMMGRRPGPDDLLIPTGYDARGRGGRERTSNHVRNKLLADLGRIELRARRTHDTRRTFISLGLADGARKEILRWVSHGPTGDIMDLYTTLPWETLCQEVAKLNIRVLESATISLLPSAASEKE